MRTLNNVVMLISIGLVALAGCLSLSPSEISGTADAIDQPASTAPVAKADEPVANSTGIERNDAEPGPEPVAIGDETRAVVPTPQEPTGDDPVANGEGTRVELTPANEEPPDLPIFDTHMHYNEQAWSVFTPADIIDKMERANVGRAVVSSTPDEGTRMLYEADPDRIVPFLRPYHAHVNSGNWFEDVTVVPYLTARLETPIYHGIGEFHLHFEGNADSPIVRQTARMAVERGFYLHIHSNAGAVRKIFEYEPEARILWAHAGMSEPPAVVSEMMDEYENLWTDISIREYQIAPDGQLDPAWRELFLKHSDRITIGSDTWVTSRWGDYEEVIRFDRQWLNQLPREVAEQIAYGNAARLFGAGSQLKMDAERSGE